jgi:hypothetical protein
MARNALLEVIALDGSFTAPFTSTGDPRPLVDERQRSPDVGHPAIERPIRSFSAATDPWSSSRILCSTPLPEVVGTDVANELEDEFVMHSPQQPSRRRGLGQYKAAT